jgi:cytochrome b561
MQPRYSRLNQSLHWITALCMFAILPLGWVMVSTAHDVPYREDLFNWHKTLGAIVLLVTAFRIVWRFRDPPPPYPPALAIWERVIAHAIYWLFFATLIWMPITGILTSGFGGHAPKLFDLIPTPQLLPKDKGLSDLFSGLHLAGQWMVYALIVLHLAAVTVHVVGRRTGVLGRMLPAGATEPAPVD